MHINFLISGPYVISVVNPVGLVYEKHKLPINFIAPYIIIQSLYLLFPLIKSDSINQNIIIFINKIKVKS